MLSSWLPSTSSSSSSLLCSSPPSLLLLRRNPRSNSLFNALISSSSSSSSFSSCESIADQSRDGGSLPRSNYSGVRFEEIVEKGSERSRLDSWISSRIDGVSRARIQSSIRSGLVSVNGRAISKASHVIKAGDKVDCVIAELQPLKAEAEDIPLNIVYEDAHVLVINKPAHMVVHPAPGNVNGTLVNGILHHCRLSTASFTESDLFSESEECSDDEFASYTNKNSNEEIHTGLQGDSVRPGIVHRLDKGTSGLLVVAKNEQSHAHLSEQFKERTICREYMSLTVGFPSPNSGRVAVPIARDLNNRIRMAAVSDPSSYRLARHAASRYRVIEMLAGGGSALLEWKLETGRTHQIRAHAKYLGIPLLGDEVYGGTKNMALSVLRARTPVRNHGDLSNLVSKLQRPFLHAFTLGFKHPYTGEDMRFSCPPPADFLEVLSQLRGIGSQKLI